MSNVIVIGAGMVGSAMAIDMAKNHNVTLTDLNEETLKKVQAICPELSVQELDVCDKDALAKKVGPFD
ncbi:MAG: NAD-binding protein, partial [Lutimonas sp.]